MPQHDPDPTGSDSEPNRNRVWMILGVVALAVVIGAVLWISSSDDDTDVNAVADTSDSTSTSTSSPQSTSSPASTDTTEPDEAEDPTEAQTGSASVTAVSVPRPDMETTGLVAVRNAQHDGYDRLVFEFDGPVPGYDVRYATAPVTDEGSGEAVEVAGDLVVTVLMDPASSGRVNADGYEQLYDGPDRIAGGGVPVDEVVEVSDFEGRSIWAVGLTGEAPFTVSTLDSPSRLVIDFLYE